MTYKIEKLLNKLTATYLSKGVQPSDICDLLFEKDYVDFTLEKTNDAIVMSVSFVEVDDESFVKQTMRYTYDIERNLQLIEQKSGRSRFKVQWSRHTALQEIITELKEQGCSLASFKEFSCDSYDELESLYLKAA
ncbi:hypothetical protein CWB73_11130 [Pseudoalteromonas phenolica]|uniref:Uncharacterized protein n=1 Tax=Pseudoalteromonas phenolica TaxID=161398 RepID=A0A5S3YUU8_9GAMM|nr:hypothetical protein [Pseudoalteromonas phenolica]TMP80577.1 hypothetical protein CWB73_11130 [Pseudoalteromonas phenolica]